MIANYNNGSYIEEAISSVFAQTYTNWEIIIVDDGSTDNSAKIFEKYINNDHFKVSFNERNEGVGYTKRKCVELSNGELCGFLDPDDELLPQALEMMVKVFHEINDISLVFSRMYICNTNMNIISKSRALNLPVEKSYFTNLDYNPEHFVAFSKNKYNLTEGISEKYKACVDLDMYFKLEEVGVLYILNKFTYKYRTNVEGSISNNIYKDHFWGIIVKYDTTLRRKLDPNDYALEYFRNFVDYIYKIGTYDGEIKIIKSKSYRLGKLFIKPIKAIRYFFYKVDSFFLFHF